MAIDWLRNRFALHSDKIAIFSHSTGYTYTDLLANAGEWTKRLYHSEIFPGSVVAFESDYSIDSIGLFLALIENGYISVPLSRTMLAFRAEFLAISEANYLFDLSKNNDEVCTLQKEFPHHSMLAGLRESKDAGLVLFTSGTSGKPKAVLHSMTRFLKKFESAHSVMTTIALPPMDHVAGLDTLFYSLASGGCFVCLENRDPETVCEYIDKYSVELVPATATFLNLLLLSEAYRSFRLDSVRTVAYGSEVMPEHTLHKLAAIFPNARFLQKYGTTELGSPRTKSESDNSIWFNINSPEIQSEVRDGVLWIRSQTSMLGYLNAPNPFDENGWYNTGDKVEIKGEYIRVLGRESSVINIGGHKVNPEEVEAVLIQIDNVVNVKVMGEKNPITGNVVKAIFKLRNDEPLDQFRNRVRDYCRQNLATYMVPSKIEISEHDFYNERLKKNRL